jgi:hypothetical protein
MVDLPWAIQDEVETVITFLDDCVQRDRKTPTGRRLFTGSDFDSNHLTNFISQLFAYDDRRTTRLISCSPQLKCLVSLLSIANPFLLSKEEIGSTINTCSCSKN